MHYLALACDYDGTIAKHGRVSTATLESLKKLAASGRKLVLVTGRELGDLSRVFPGFSIFDRVVAENGALLYRPDSREERLLVDPPAEVFVSALRSRGVRPLSVGKAVVATQQPHETTVLETIRDLGLELEVIFNKGSVMVLPSGVNKAFGLKRALSELGLSPHNCVAIGDAENDQAMLAACDCGVAVADALPTLKHRSDRVMKGENEDGVVELIEQILADDLAGYDSEIRRNQVLLGHDDQDGEVRIDPHRTCILMTGASGSGKTTVATALLERLLDLDYQACVIDPEGDYEAFPSLLNVGDPFHSPPLAEIRQLLERFENPCVNLLGIPLADRPEYFEKILPEITRLRAGKGRPHWLLIDEAHHLLPASWRPAPAMLPQVFSGTVLVTVHPQRVAPSALSAVDLLIAVGEGAKGVLEEYARALGQELPVFDPPRLEKMEAMVWFRREPGPPRRVRVIPGRLEHDRHRRKYAEGDLHQKAFFFRGPSGKLNLRAQNLSLFVQIAEGVDDDTWLFHLRRHDYSRWIRDSIKDEELASQIEAVEDSDSRADSSRDSVRRLIGKTYTGAA